jgi:hypothetical protein
MIQKWMHLLGSLFWLLLTAYHKAHYGPAHGQQLLDRAILLILSLGLLVGFIVILLLVS